MNYKFSKNSSVLLNGSQVILGNNVTGDWIKMSKQVYDILKLGHNKNLSIYELSKYLYDDEDREYINIMYDNLRYLKIILNKNYKEKIEHKVVSFEITNRCNLKCAHCCINATGIMSDKKDLSKKEVINILDKIIEWNPRKIMLSGGEPMIRADFFEIIAYLRERYKRKIIISTNGTCINSSNVEKLISSVDQIDISLDGIDEETCSIIRGKGVYEKVINSVKLLKDKNFNDITLSMVISDNNEHLKEGFINLSEDLEVKPIFRGFQSIGRGALNKNKFLSQSENESYIPNKITKRLGVCNCSAVKRELFIRYNGDVYPCPALNSSEHLLGNILLKEKVTDLNAFSKENTQDLLTRMLELESFKECVHCKVNLFCLSCPGTVDILKNNHRAFKNRCNKLKPILFKEVWGEVL